MMRLQASEAADETRDEIVRQATQLFTHYGYSKTNIGDIALEVQSLVGLTMIYAIKMGIDPGAIAFGSLTPSAEMHWFSSSELNKFDLVTVKDHT